MIDTCEAETMYSKITSPNVIAIASSRKGNTINFILSSLIHLKGESSYSQAADPVLGVSLVDRFTSASLDFFEDVQITSNAKLADLIDSFKWENIVFSQKERRLNVLQIAWSNVYVEL